MDVLTWRRRRRRAYAAAAGSALVSIAAGLLGAAFAGGRRRALHERARAQERRRIADALHDEAAPLLFLARVTLDSLLEQQPESPAAAPAIRARELVDRADVALRAATADAPARDPGMLAERLEQLVAASRADLGIEIDLTIAEAARAASGSLRRDAADALLRVAHEALVNAAKHAAPCRSVVRFEVAPPGRLRVAVADDGQGAVPDTTHDRYGLASLERSMRRVGGTLEVSSDRRGVTVTAVVATTSGEPRASSGARQAPVPNRAR